MLNKIVVINVLFSFRYEPSLVIVKSARLTEAVYMRVFIAYISLATKSRFCIE